MDMTIKMHGNMREVCGVTHQFRLGHAREGRWHRVMKCVGHEKK